MTYKLIHFNTRFLAEPIRFIFAYCEVPYEDIRISYDEWKESRKEATRWNQLPILILPNGKEIGQSMAIQSYLAQLFKLSGTDEWEMAQCSEMSDSLRDLRQEWRKYFFQRNRERKADAKRNFIEGAMKKYFGHMEKRLEENGGVYLVGNGITYIDLATAQLVGFFYDTVDNNCMDAFPGLKAHKDMVWEIPNIKKWLQTRPQASLAILSVVVSV